MINFVRAMVLAGLVALVPVAPAAAASGAPGPGLETPVATLDAALGCQQDLGETDATPILLIPGTGSNPEEIWRWGYGRVLPGRGFPVCTLRLPERATADMQASAEYVVHAIRDMYRWAERKISVLGHSQGGTNAVWALKFWPDLPEMVDDVVLLGSPVNGTMDAKLWCNEHMGCQAAAWQQATGSRHSAALNALPLPKGPSFTQIWTGFDEISTPAHISTHLRGGTNLQVQDLCPGRLVEHILLAADGAVFDIAVDALTHSGPGNLARIPAAASCGQFTMPGIDMRGFLRWILPGQGRPLWEEAGGKNVKAEPTLRPYARAVLV